MKKIYSFNLGYGAFSRTLSYGALNLELRLEHRKTLWVKCGEREEDLIQISCITGRTPSTYHSGNREYGKYIFITSDNIRVVMNEYTGGSNSEACGNNTSLLKSGGYSSGSFGFDFFRITKIGDENLSMEVSEKIKEISFHGFGDMDNETFIFNAMPENLREIIPSFPYQTSGWRRNDSETFLHAVTKIGDVSVFIPFASSSMEIQEMDTIETRYLKQIK